MNVDQLDLKTHAGTKPGQYFHFDFYVEKDGGSIDPAEAHDLLGHLIHWVREQGYGFDGGAKLGNWLMKSPEEERQ